MLNKLYSGYLYQMLMEYGSVHISSIGTFILEYREAEFQEFRLKLSPPSSSILFTNDSTTEGRSYKDLLMEFGMPEEDADFLQTSLVTEYKNSIEHTGVFELSQLGVFTSDAFNPFDENIFNVYRGLETVAITPLPKGIRGVSHDDNFKSDLSKHQSRKSAAESFYWLPLIIILIVLSFLFLRTCNTDSKPSKKPTTEIKPIVPVTTDTLPSEDTITDADFNGSESPDFPPTDTSKTPSIDSSISISNGTSCAIIVGSFKYRPYAKRLQKMVEKRGYTSYTEDYGQYRRVGILFDCDTTDAEVFKEKIRSEFSRDAWDLADEKNN